MMAAWNRPGTKRSDFAGIPTRGPNPNRALVRGLPWGQSTSPPYCTSATRVTTVDRFKRLFLPAPASSTPDPRCARLRGRHAVFKDGA